MKTKLFTFICLLAISLCSITASAAEKLLPQLKKQPGLTSVYVGKALLNMAGGSRGMEDLPGVNMSAMGKNMDSLEIITAETPGAAKYLRPLAAEAIDNIAGLELAMEKAGDDSTAQIYVMPSADGKYYTRLIILVSETHSYTIIDMQGTLPLDALNSN